MILRNISKMILPAFLAMGFVACDIDTIDDPNNPSVGAISANASLSEIQNLVTGIEAGMRLNLGQYYDGVGVIGRDFYRFSTSDPRFTSDLLGKGSATLDNNTFYTTNPYSSRYRAVKNANILLEAVDNSTALTTAEARNAVKGYANTIKAYQLLLVWVQQYDNGIRIEVSNADDLGPFIGENDHKAALRAIAMILDEGYGQLTSGGAEFPFSLSSGFTGFDTPVAFAHVNRALLARVQAYNENWDNALDALGSSFLDLGGDLNTGVYHTYSTAGGDALNPQWYPLNATGESRVAHPSFVADAEAGDMRLSKATARDNTEFQDGLQSDYDFTVYANNSSSIPIIRNEELILLYAEANIQKGDATSLNNAVSALDVIRNAAGLPDYSGPVDQAALLDEMLMQRRYSLYGEGHRWVDMRRYGRLDELPLDRSGDDVWTKFPRPANED
ncbi:MAG: RagB/SusD family nutrient uptake outer membrane protein [Lewinellaceae bacterium]|nr:RagB/SusD family nutrient uptake outer membrane protein [Saprospiraceae bacterium]MCB9306683.1 RagB/SusD family nutrient uptake outer membrane protein [Lewinellaceae bacterium]MCB9353030.1 RagB/SusD family nutrient uptake outer membrane protein [Lewinellaceae bacterium]